MLKVEQNLGLSGEFRVVVRRADGSIKLDTGTQPNLILDNGLRNYLDMKPVNNKGEEQTTTSDIMSACVVGVGNKAPDKTDIGLQSIVSLSQERRENDYGVEYPETGKHEGYAKLWYKYKFVFTGISNKNITELGLAYGSSTETYTLFTRALVKDSSGSPITVTVLAGEILEIIYQINVYVDITKKTGSFTLTTVGNGNDVESTFDYFIQPYALSSYNLSYPIQLDGYNSNTLTWGVKEGDNALTGDYALDSDAYRSVTYKMTTDADITNSLQSVIAGSSSYSGDNTTNKASDRYQTATIVDSSIATGRLAKKFAYGIYTHNHENGIRVYRVKIVQNNGTMLNVLVVLKNRANGQGIKKTNRQVWEHELSYTLTRWED